MRRITPLVLIAALTNTARGQTPTELIPDAAAFAVVVRSQEELQTKGDKFLKDTMLNLPLRPSQLFDFAYQFLGVTNGLDRRGSAAVMLLGPEKKGPLGLQRLEELGVAAVPYSDAGEMLGNFKLDMLKPGEVGRSDRHRFARRFRLQPKHLYLGKDERALQRAIEGKPIAAALTPAQRRRFDASDLLIEFAPRNIGEEFRFAVGELERALKTADDPAERETVQQFIAAVKELQFALAGVRLDDGLGLNFLTRFPKDGAAAVLLKNAGAGTSSVRGLPDGRVLAAQAFSADGRKTALLNRVLFEHLLREALLNRPFGAGLDPPVMTGLFREVWQRLRGGRLALYHNADESQNGLFSAVAILDAEDGAAFLREMKALARLADGDKLDLTRPAAQGGADVPKLIAELGADAYAARQAATLRLSLIGEPALPYFDKALAAGGLDLETKRRVEKLHAQISKVAAARRKELLAKDVTKPLRPSLTFVPAPEQRQGTAVDVVHVRLDGADRATTDTLRQLLGPDWDKLRLAAVGDRVAVLVGSDTVLLDAALQNLKADRPGLAESKALAAFAKRAEPGRQAELHVSVEALAGLIAPPAPKGAPALTSFALSLGADYVQLELWAPTTEVAAVIRRAVPR